MNRPFDPKRAARGTAIVHTNERYRNSNNSVGDVLLDLIHHSVQCGVDFEKELEFARRAFEEDTQS